MAYQPCDCHGRPFRGKSQYFYPALIQGATRIGERKRLCPEGAAVVQTALGKHFVELNGDASDQVADPNCGWCGKPAGDEDTASLVYATSYLGDGARRDFFARACKTHRAAAARDAAIAV